MAVMVRPHAPVPVHAPLYPAKVLGATGVAVKVTCVPLGYVAEQVPEEIPAVVVQLIKF